MPSVKYFILVSWLVAIACGLVDPQLKKTHGEVNRGGRWGILNIRSSARCLLQLRGGIGADVPVPRVHIDDLKRACNVSEAEEEEEEAEEGENMQDEKRVLPHDDVMTADQCIGFAETAFEEGRYDDAVDLLTVAIEEKIDNFEEDSVECVRAVLMLSRSLYEKEVLSNFSDANSSYVNKDASADSDGSDDDCFNPMQSAWTALKQAREVLERKGKDDKLLAEVFVEMSKWIMSPWSRTVDVQWEKERARIVSAVKCMKRCLKIRYNLFSEDAREIAEGKERLQELQDKLDREACALHN